MLNLLADGGLCSAPLVCRPMQSGSFFGGFAMSRVLPCWEGDGVVRRAVYLVLLMSTRVEELETEKRQTSNKERETIIKFLLDVSGYERLSWSSSRARMSSKSSDRGMRDGTRITLSLILAYR